MPVHRLPGRDNGSRATRPIQTPDRHDLAAKRIRRRFLQSRPIGRRRNRAIRLVVERRQSARRPRAEHQRDHLAKPTAVGPNSFTVQLKDSTNATVKQSLSTSSEPVGHDLHYNPARRHGGSAYSQALTAMGGLPPFQWTLASGTLPAGISLNSSGTLSGTPSAAGTSSFSVQVTDANSSTDTQSLTIQVIGGVTITTISLPAGAVGDSYSQTLSATGGLGVYVWTVSAGSLPGGSSLSTAGVISGTPSTSGTFNFTVKAVSVLSSAAEGSEHHSKSGAIGDDIVAAWWCDWQRVFANVGSRRRDRRG